ncbi:class I lanthipeptide [Larkinella ripae]
MKKQLAKLTLKTDQIIALSNAQARSIAGGRPVEISKHGNCSGHTACPTKI